MRSILGHRAGVVLGCMLWARGIKEGASTALQLLLNDQPSHEDGGWWFYASRGIGQGGMLGCLWLWVGIGSRYRHVWFVWVCGRLISGVRAQKRKYKRNSVISVTIATNPWSHRIMRRRFGLTKRNSRLPPVGAHQHRTWTPGSVGRTSVVELCVVARLVSSRNGDSMRNTFVRSGSCAGNSRICWMRLCRVSGRSVTVRGVGLGGVCMNGSSGRKRSLETRRLRQARRSVIRIGRGVALLLSPFRSCGECRRLSPGANVEKDKSGNSCNNGEHRQPTCTEEVLPCYTR